MAKKQNKVVSKTPKYGKRLTKNGKKERTGTVLTLDNGEKVTYLTPSGKAAKAAFELHNGYKVTNVGKRKVDDSGNVMLLTDTEAAWRSGYLAARQDSAKAYKANRGKKS